MDTRRCRHRSSHLVVWWSLLLLSACATTNADLCDVTSSQSAIILDLPESIGDQTDQSTTPGELPLEGVAGQDIDLTLSREGLDFFNLTGKKLRLLHPLDRDEEDLLTLRFTVVCRVVGSSSQRSVPVVVRVGDRNDNPPRFVGAPYSVTIPESTPVGATIFSDFSATDADAGANGQIRYSIVPGNGGPTDGVGVLTIPLPHQPHVTVAQPLDYERARVLVVNIQASDTSPTNQQTSITTLTVVLQDSDDQDPQFTLTSCPPSPSSDGGGPPSSGEKGCPTPPQFSSSVVAGKRVGVMDVKPERIHALDKDSMAAPIRYSLDSGSPSSFRQFFSIDSRSGALSQIAPVPRGLTAAFSINVKAEEQTPRRGSVSTSLTITVTNPDSAMPVVRASSLLGRVEENSAPGTEVRTNDDQPVTLSVSDPDLLPGEAGPSYLFELTTGAFRVTGDGVLIVAVAGLDRDPPSPHTHTFQVVAREVSKEGTAGAASAPITVTVELLDANDHSPRFPVYPPVVVPAGARQHTLAQVHALDPDEGSNGALQYELAAVTGGKGGHTPTGGRGQFVVDADNGEVRLVGEVETGEQYTLQIKATDGGGREGSTLLDVRVARGPNTGGPYFPRRRFATIVPEDTLPGTTIIKLKAVDPDGDVPRYSLHAMSPSDRPTSTGGAREEGRRSLGGDEGGVNASLPFQVDPLSGEVTLAAAVDRETKNQYHMIVTAEDDEGLRGSVTLDVTISDVNDVRPTFQDLPYSFRVDEGREGALLGVVKATDMDEDRSGLVEFSVPEDAPLSVGPYNGTIYTKTALDFEKQQVHYVVVTATDGGRPPLSATTTLTLLVGDISDEPPIFPKTLYKTQVSEAVEIGSLVTTVKAEDPDSSPSVTYVLRSVGREARVFSVHPDTGRVTVMAPLDRETAEEFVLIIGTEENTGDGKGATCTVQVSLQDANDATPALSPLPPVLVSLDTPPGAALTTAEATDGDATAPFNKVRFELVTEEAVSEYLSIDQHSGVITLLKKLAHLNVTEVQAEVVARDGGDPPRSSSTPLLLLVEVEGAPPPRIVLPPAFSRSQVFVTVKEDMAVGGMLARVGIINPPLQPICALQETSDHFKAVLTDSGDCGVQLLSPVDAEQLADVNTLLTLELQTADHQYRTPNVTAKINITVEDVNDNAPRFLITEEVLNSTSSTEDTARWGGEEAGTPLEAPVLTRHKSSRGSDTFMTLGPHTVLVTISEDIAVGKIVTELKATDLDSGPNGAVHYSLLPKSNRGGYFALDTATGILVTARPLTDVSKDLNPFNLTVRALDSPIGKQPKTAQLTVLVNVIGAAHRVVVPVSAQPVHLVARRQQMLQAIADRDDAAVVLERIVAAPSLSSSPSSREVAHHSLPPSSEVWLALLDPSTGHLLPRTHPRVNRVLSQASDVPGSLRQQLLTAIGAETLQEQQVVHQSHAPPRRRPVPLGESVFGGASLSDGGPESVIASLPGLQLGLVILAIVILVLGLFSILYVCIQWARAVRDRDKSAGLPILRVPILPHPAPSTITDTLNKQQYEVQVLSMSVPLDDDSLKDVSPPRSARNFFMDNVSYISKNNPMADDSRSDVGHPVLDVSSSPPWGVAPSTSGGGGGGYPPNHGGMTIRSTNSGYHQHQQQQHRRGDSSADDSDDLDDITGGRGLSHSATNHNVLFGRRGDAGDARGELRGDLRGDLRGELRGELRGNPRGEFRGDPRGGSTSSTDSSSPSHRHHRLHDHHQTPHASTLEGRFRAPHSNSYNNGGSVNNTYTSEGGRRGGGRGGINAGYRQDPEDDDGIIGYGFEGAGIGGPMAPILDLSPVQTTTLL